MTPSDFHAGQWHHALSEHLRELRPAWADRVEVLDETASTQDAAWLLSKGAPGLIVTTDRQTAGRGRLGRPWHQAHAHGIAISVTLDPALAPPERLPILAGLAALAAASRTLSRHGASQRLALRWPNDLVEHHPHARGRKLAGVLIERRGDVLILGIGLNVTHEPDDFPPQLRERCASLAMLLPRGDRAAPPARLAVIVDLLTELNAALDLAPAQAVHQWQMFDALTGTRQTFVHDGRQTTGMVLGIDPSSAIRLQADDGSIHHLPALTTSLVHDGA